MEGLNILVVDDDPLIRDAIGERLREQGHAVSEASNGTEALEVLSSLRFDVLVTDILMPYSDGFELIRYVKRWDPRVKIIAMSGGGIGAANHYLQVAQEFGADASLAKPFAFSELSSALSAVDSI